MSLTYFLNDLEMVPVAPIITGITLVFTFHMRCISIVRALFIIIIIIIIIAKGPKNRQHFYFALKKRKQQPMLRTTRQDI